MNPDYKDIINSIGELHKLQQQVIKDNMPYFKSEVNTIVGNKIKDEDKKNVWITINKAQKHNNVY